MERFGDNLKALRIKANLNIKQLAEKVEISGNTMAAYERNVVTPTIYNAHKISKFFNVPLEYMIYGENAIAEFSDMELLKLAKEVDGLMEEDKELAKKFLKKLIKNRGERDTLKKEAIEE